MFTGGDRRAMRAGSSGQILMSGAGYFVTEPFIATTRKPRNGGSSNGDGTTMGTGAAVSMWALWTP